MQKMYIFSGKELLLFYCLFIFYPFFGFAQDIKILEYRVSDLVYEPNQQKIYAAIPDGVRNKNSICRINPYLGTIEQCYPVGIDPRKLAISDDGKYIYIGFWSTPEVKRFNTETQQIDQIFTIGSYPVVGDYLFVEDMVVMPGQPTIIAVARKNRINSPTHQGVAIFDNGAMRPNISATLYQNNSIAFDEDGVHLYGYENGISSHRFQVMSVNAQGVKVDTAYSDLLSGFGDEIEFKNNKIYSNTGRIIRTDTIPPNVEGSLNFTIRDGSAVEPAPDSNIIYVVSNVGGVHYFFSFNSTFFNVVNEYPIEGAYGEVKELIHWGDRGKLAYFAIDSRTADGYLVILNSCTPQLTTPLPISPLTLGGCVGDEITITAEPGYPIYYWSNGASTTINKLVTYNSGVFSYRVPDAGGCLSVPSQIANIEVDFPTNAPFIQNSSPIRICQGDSVKIIAFADNTSLTYLWSNNIITSKLELNVSVPGTYSLRTISPKGCLSASSNLVTVEVSTNVPPKPTIVVNGNVLASSATSGNQWFLNGEAIVGATGRFYQATVSGFYTVRVTLDVCVSEVSDLYSFTITDVDDQSEKAAISVYPNPVNSLLTITLEGETGSSKTIELFDVTGKLVVGFSVPNSTNQYDLSTLPTGMYLLQIREETNQTLIYRQKLIKL